MQLTKPFRFVILSVFMVLAIYSFTTNDIWAHGGLIRSEPPVESVLKRAPPEIKLYFSEKIEDAYSFIHVMDSNGGRVDKDDSYVDRTNPILLRTTLNTLKEGSYTVNWRVLSVDSHVTEGTFTFTMQ